MDTCVRMQGNDKIIQALNKALTIELTAINQYFVQAKMCLNWGYKKLGKKIYDESIGEMKHADKLIDRIIFLEGTPKATGPTALKLGGDVLGMLKNDLSLELTGARSYNEAIDICVAEKDAGSREIMEHILIETEEHVDWLEAQINVIETVGIERYLAEQLGGE